MERKTRRQKMKTVESLVCMVKSVENQYTTIDLQNETSVYGLVKEVDWYYSRSGIFRWKIIIYDCLYIL